jgi:hypothetical protein
MNNVEKVNNPTVEVGSYFSLPIIGNKSLYSQLNCTIHVLRMESFFSVYGSKALWTLADFSVSQSCTHSV